MSEEDTVHPVVRLLAKRMESHPEEFGHKGSGRWASWLEPLMRLATDEEKLLLRIARMNEIHEEVMDELLNGDERRAQEKRERYLETQRMMAQAQVQGLQPGGQYAQVQTLGALQSASTIRLGNETLSEGLLKSIKGKLGL